MTGVANNGSQRISTTSLVHKLPVQIVKNKTIQNRIHHTDAQRAPLEHTVET